MTDVLIERGHLDRDTYTEGRQCEDTGKTSCASQGTHEVIRSQERGMTHIPPPQHLEGINPTNTLILNFSLPNSKTINFCGSRHPLHGTFPWKCWQTNTPSDDQWVSNTPQTMLAGTNFRLTERLPLKVNRSYIAIAENKSKSSSTSE